MLWGNLEWPRGHGGFILKQVAEQGPGSKPHPWPLPLAFSDS